MASLSFCRRTAFTKLRPLTESLRSRGWSRNFSFSFAGPRNLADILQKEAVGEKTGSEVAELWETYHKGKNSVIGFVCDGKTGSSVLARATVNPFFVQPVFRDDGFFMLISQFQAPTHFLMAYLEDYKMDPHSATPLLTFSVFDDYAETKDICLVRCDILNSNINDDEGQKVVESLLENYTKDDDYGDIKTFNERPNDFDIDDYISRMNDRWKSNA